MDTHDHAWAAGFVDGEGHVYISRRRQRKWTAYIMGIRVSQKSRRPLERLEAMYGGSICAPDRKHSIYQWNVSASKAREAMEHMLPYFVLKREQVELALAFQSRRNVRGQVGRGRGPARDASQDEDDFHAMKELRLSAAQEATKEAQQKRAAS